MNKLKFILLCLLLHHTGRLQAQYFDYVYTGGDEFNGPYLDLTQRWKLPDHRTLYGNYELQCYTDSGNMFLSGGHLYITAKKEPITARVFPYEPDTHQIWSLDRSIYYGQNLRSFDYTSGQIESRQRYKYGYFEAYLQIPFVKGTWPAFWMFGTAAPYSQEEIDIGEFKGEKPGMLHVDVHPEEGVNNGYINTPNIQSGEKVGGWINVERSAFNVYNGKFVNGVNLSQGFQMLSLKWEHPDRLSWYLNYNPIFFIRKKFTYQKNIILNMAVASHLSPFNPGPDANSLFPAHYIIDFVRHYYEMDCNRYEELSDYIQYFFDPTIHTGQEVIYGTGNVDLANGIIKNSYLLGPMTFWPDGQYLQLIGSERVAINPNAAIYEGSHFSAKIIPCGQVQRSSEGSGIPDPADPDELLPIDLPDLGDSARLPIFEQEGGEGEGSRQGHAPPPFYRFYPNPSNGQFRVAIDPEQKASLHLYDLQGRLVYSSQIEGQLEPVKDFNLQKELAAGLYLARLVFNQSEDTETFKVYIALP